MPPRAASPWPLLAAFAIGCSSAPPPAAAPAAAAAPAPSRPATFAFFFVFEPGLRVGLRRDGVPYEGQAELDTAGTPLPGPAGEEGARFRGNVFSATPDGALPARLAFRGGKAEVPPELIDALASAGPLVLRVEDQEVPMPRGGNVNPFRCARSLDALEQIDPCAALLPSADLAPDECDGQGQAAWRSARAAKQERFEGCFAELSRETAERLERAPALAPLVCPRFSEMTGPEPEEDIGVKLLPLCGAHFSPQARQRLERVKLRRELPQALERARSGTTDAMRSFYLAYREVAPAQAEEIRKLAADRFGPKDRKTWLALRDALEGIKLSRRRFTLCDVQKPTADVAIGFDRPPRYAGGPSLVQPGEPEFVPVRVVMDYDRGRRFPDAREKARIEALIRARTGATQVRYASYCVAGRHWYFAPGPLP